MSDLSFFTVMAILIAALFAVMWHVASMIVDEFREGHRRVGVAMIAAVAVMVVGVLPWYLL